MSNLDVFRQDFAALLQGYAADCRRGLRGGRVGAEDLEIIVLFERLARQAERLDHEVFETCQGRLGREPLAHCFTRHREGLLSQIGILYWPNDASDLLRWMTVRVTTIMPQFTEPHVASSDAASSALTSALLHEERKRAVLGFSPRRPKATLSKRLDDWVRRVVAKAEALLGSHGGWDTARLRRRRAYRQACSRAALLDADLLKGDFLDAKRRHDR